MRKLWILILLLMIPLVQGLEDCKKIVTTAEVPCNIISSEAYSDCNSTQARIFDSVPSLLSVKNYTDYINKSRCNFTWDISTIGSYIGNVTPDGEPFRVIVEAEDTTDKMISIIIGLAIAVAAFGIIGFMNPGQHIGRFSLRVLAYSMSALQLLNIFFVLYAQESGGSLLPILKTNFIGLMIVAGGFGFVTLLRFISRLINPADEEDAKEEEKGWNNG